jgi:hypothetical protein
MREGQPRYRERRTSHSSDIDPVYERKEEDKWVP